MCNVYDQSLPLDSFNRSTKGLLDPVSIYHYRMQSYYDYLRRKIQRPRDDFTNRSYTFVTSDGR
jgi:hypothetical protein